MKTLFLTLLALIISFNTFGGCLDDLRPFFSGRLADVEIRSSYLAGLDEYTAAELVLRKLRSGELSRFEHSEALRIHTLGNLDRLVQEISEESRLQGLRTRLRPSLNFNFHMNAGYVMKNRVERLRQLKDSISAMEDFSYHDMIEKTLKMLQLIDPSATSQMQSSFNRLLQSNSDNLNILYFPIFGHAGIITINHLQTEGVYILGVTSRTMSVDGVTMPPWRYLQHDLSCHQIYSLENVHSLLSRTSLLEAENRIQLRRKIIIDIINELPERERLMAEVMHFIIHHEVENVSIFSPRMLERYLDNAFLRGGAPEFREYIDPDNVDLRPQLRAFGVLRTRAAFQNLFSEMSTIYLNVVKKAHRDHPDIPVLSQEIELEIANFLGLIEN